MGVPADEPGPVSVLVPVKAFAVAKVRLAPALGPTERAELARRMATAVIRAAEPLPVAVVCEDDGVAAWAAGLGATVMWEPGRGLNGAVQSGVDRLAGLGFRRVIVAHADLPWASQLAPLAPGSGVTLVPDRRHDGTNVVAIPARSGFRFSYGPGSFGRHCQEAARLGLELSVHEDPKLSFDVDVPADLELMA